MRKNAVAIVGVLAALATVSAQPPIKDDPGVRLVKPAGAGQLQPQLDPNNRLDVLLMQWEKRMEGVDSVLVADCKRTDKVKSDTKVMKGEARYLKPSLAALRLIQVDNPQIYELIISTGNYLYEYRPQFKKRVIHELPPNRAGAFDKNLLSFLFGMGAIDAKRRYDLTLRKDLSAENQHYIYISIKPKFAEDKREFTQAEVVLFAQTMLPRRLWYETPNGSEVTWDLPNMDTTMKLKATDFTPPDKPAGWEDQKYPYVPPTTLPNSGQPNKVRPNPDK